jgi:hypothetical protein
VLVVVLSTFDVVVVIVLVVVLSTFDVVVLSTFDVVVSEVLVAVVAARNSKFYSQNTILTLSTS